MGRPLRFIPEGGTLVEITTRTIQGRYLLRPDSRGRVNEIVVGVLARAQELYGVRIVAVSALSTHIHILAFFEDAQQLASFMCHINGNLSEEIGRLHSWPGKLWSRRYRDIPVSDEEEAQVARLKYILGAAVKEHLVEKAIDWPGVHSARALLHSQRLRGWWFDRSREFTAVQRGEKPGRYEFAEEKTLTLDPLPCWQHLPARELRRRIRELVREIEREAALERRKEDQAVRGAAAVMSTAPHYRPEKLETSPAPRFHAFRKRVRRKLWEAYAWVVAEYRKAAEHLRDGDRFAKFPEGTFPPKLPFVAFARAHPT